jgi:hypothetical protein
LKKVLLYFHTLKYLKWKQVRYRAYYYLRKKLGIEPKIPEYKDNNRKADFTNHVILYKTWLGGNAFRFLNLEKDFGNEIDWNYSGYGKLWTYNLNYFEFLLQEGISKEAGIELIGKYIAQYDGLKDGKEPFPTSLRLVNWIKFLIIHKIDDVNIREYIHQDAWRLYHYPEYHLLGNHLLENAFALVIGSVYLEDYRLFRKGINILESQLDEQILNDGAHFELSPMYHCLMLYRLQDCIQFLQVNHWQMVSQRNIDKLVEYAGKMMGWLKNISYSDNSFPHFNDSTNGIAPLPVQLFEYGRLLGINTSTLLLKESGYRRLRNTDIDMIVMAGSIGAAYIPGHAHADSLSFECRLNNHPFIVDMGISTYEKTQLRQMQRSTQSHNTVVVNNKNSSEVWGGFRVAKRAKTKILFDGSDRLSLVHFGYEKPVFREFILQSQSLKILDKVEAEADLFLHFNPDILPVLNLPEIMLGSATILFNGAKSITVHDYNYCLGFNKTTPAKKLCVRFEKQLETIIKA